MTVRRSALIQILFVAIFSLVFPTIVFAQSQAANPGTAGASEDPDELVDSKTPKGTHPDDGSDLGTVTGAGLKENSIYWMCRNQSVVRTLRIEATPTGCQTTYVKDGVEKIVSQAQTYFSCVGIFANIRRNLEVAGWKCKDISKSRVSSGL